VFAVQAGEVEYHPVTVLGRCRAAISTVRCLEEIERPRAALRSVSGAVGKAAMSRFDSDRRFRPGHAVFRVAVAFDESRMAVKMTAKRRPAIARHTTTSR